MTRTLMSVDPNTAMPSGLALTSWQSCGGVVGGRVERDVDLLDEVVLVLQPGRDQAGQLPARPRRRR